jgi:hypothetical protein
MKYIGKGAFLAGVPARDLTEEEVEKYNRQLLIHSGLYVDEKQEPKPQEKIEFRRKN